MKPIWEDSGGIQVFLYGQTGFSDVFFHTLSEIPICVNLNRNFLSIFSTYNCAEKNRYRTPFTGNQSKSQETESCYKISRKGNISG